jgi:hypothetical protein
MDLNAVLFYLLILSLAGVVLHALVVGPAFLASKAGERRANLCFGILLITFGLTLLHNIFTFTDFYEHHPSLRFLPIYFTLAFPPLLFFYVKLNLYPSYQLRWTDGKYFLLPLFQWIYFVGMFFADERLKMEVDRQFYNPFYGAMEQGLYLVTFIAYMYFAYRYLRRKRSRISSSQEAKKVLYLEKMLQVLFVLFGIHVLFVLADFAFYEFFGINLRSNKPFAALGALSFAAVLLWLSMYGFQVLVWGRRYFRTREDRTAGS